MNKNHNESNKSDSAVSSKDKRNDTIPFRIDSIKKLLGGKKLEPLVDMDNCDTEQFIHPNGYNFIDSGSDNSDDNCSRDSRVILNKKIHDFYEVINDVGGKLLYVKSGTTGHTFKGIISSESGVETNYAVKVVAYPKKERYGDIHDIKRPENAELMMIRLLSYFVIKKQTPHIVLPMGSFNTSIKPFVNLINDQIVDDSNKKYKEFVEKWQKKEYYGEVSILISEWANQGDLLDFMRKWYREFELMEWKVIFFQIISVLAVIHSKFPGFRHNDLKANNILVHKINHRRTLYRYLINGQYYVFPNIGYQIKLWDYDFACIPGIVENAKVEALWTNEINVKPVQNRYYDLHYFFNTLIKKGFFPEIMVDKNIPNEVREFINRVVPPEYQNDKNGKVVSKRGRILIDTEYLTPDKVLKHDEFFKEFRDANFKKSDPNILHKEPKNVQNDKINGQTCDNTRRPRKYVLSHSDKRDVK